MKTAACNTCADRIARTGSAVEGARKEIHDGSWRAGTNVTSEARE